MKYLIVIEPSGPSWSANVPDLPGCIAAGATPQEARERMQEAARLHVAGLADDGDPVPAPVVVADYVEV